MKIISRVVDAPNNSTSLARLPTNNQLPSIRRYRYLANMSTDRWQQAVAEHEDILIAIEARDGERLGAILKLHFTNRFSTVCEWLENNP